MMNHSRRSLLSATALALPFGLGSLAKGASSHPGAAPTLRFRPFEDAVREAFADRDPFKNAPDRTSSWRTVEVGHSEQVQEGLQGSHNDRPFAGFPAGHLRIIRTGSEPGPLWQGVRLYISTVDIAFTGGLTPEVPGRPLDFASLPPVPTFS